jgi:curved DNA-binding protein CbpA
MAAPKATAAGTLGSTPIPNLLVYALDRRLTGTLVIEEPTHRKSAVSFRNGAPVKARLGEPQHRLGDVLVELGSLDANTARNSYVEGRLHGQVLLEQKLVSKEAVEEALGEQILRKIEWLCVVSAESVFGYYDGEDFLSGFGPPEGAIVEPLEAVYRAVRRQVAAPVVDATLAKLGTRELRLHPGARPGRFGFDARERGVVDVIRAKPQPLSALLATELLPSLQLKRVVYVLAVTRHLDLGAGVMPLGVGASSVSPGSNFGARPDAPRERADAEPREPARPKANSVADPTPAPAPVNEATEALRREIRARADVIGDQNYYEILGVPRDAPAPTIQGAFFQLAKTWHPDRLPPELADVRDLAVRIFARMSEANQVLTNEEQRKEYERLMDGGGASSDEQEEVQRVLRAATAFQKAEVLARRGNLEEAERQARIAAENDPEQAEYTALYADLLSQKPERAQSGQFADVLRMVNDAKKRQPDNLKVRLYRARVLKRSGDVDTAYREFRGIVELDAHNVEAAREVRLHEMRRGKSGTDPKKTDPKKTDPKKTDPKKTDPKKTDPKKTGDGASRQSDKPKGGKDLLNQDIGQLFGKLFKR